MHLIIKAPIILYLDYHDGTARLVLRVYISNAIRLGQFPSCDHLNELASGVACADAPNPKLSYLPGY